MHVNEGQLDRNSNHRIADQERLQKFKMFFAGLIFAIISFTGTNPIKDAPCFIKVFEVMNYSRQPLVWREFLGSTP